MKRGENEEPGKAYVGKNMVVSREGTEIFVNNGSANRVIMD
jgi:hypothetical protein